MFESFLTTDLPGLGFTSLNQLVLPFLASRVAVMKGFRDAQYSEEEAAIQRCICPFNDSILLIMREANCDRLEAAVPEIQRIFQVFQSPSFSVGVLHRNRTIFTRGFGYSDINAGRVPDSETIYCLGSCRKAFTALALVLLTQQGRIKWEAPISDCLPAFDTPYNPDVGHNSTLANILSHSAGLAPLLHGILGKNDSIFTWYDDVVHISSRLSCWAPLRSEWQYNNWFYAFAACRVHSVSEAKWSACVQEIIQTLELSRTDTCPPFDDNFARAYIVFSDGSSVERLLPSLEAGDAFNASGSIRSRVKDMLTWYQALIGTSKIPAHTGEEAIEVVLALPFESIRRLSRHNLLKALRVIQRP
jgi:CubicO group peptidase (beta-lactamase class C family)